MALKSRVADILLKAGVIDELQLRSAMAQYDRWGGRLEKIVADLGLADEDAIAQAIAQAMKLPRMSIGRVPKDAAALGKIDVQFAEKKAVFPVQLKDNGKTLVLAMADPTDLAVIDEVANRSNARVKVVVAGATEIAHAILRYYRNQEPPSAASSRARRAVRTAGKDEELDLISMSQPQDIRAVTEAAERAAPRHPPEMELLSPATSQANAMLEEMLGATPPDGLSAEERSRVEALRINQQKSSQILRAVAELLIEKGHVTAKELQNKANRS